MEILFRFWSGLVCRVSISPGLVIEFTTVFWNVPLFLIEVHLVLLEGPQEMMKPKFLTQVLLDRLDWGQRSGKKWCFKIKEILMGNLLWWPSCHHIRKWVHCTTRFFHSLVYQAIQGPWCTFFLSFVIQVINRMLLTMYLYVIFS